MRKLYTVRMTWADGRVTFGEFRTQAGAEGRVEWCATQDAIVKATIKITRS